MLTDSDMRKMEAEGTNGANYDLDTDAIIAKLRDWDTRLGIAVSEITAVSMVVKFERLPDDTGALAEEVYDFCPDTVDQHWGCVAEMVEMAEETGEEVPEHIASLIGGVDFSDERYGVELLRRDLVARRTVDLWWD